MKKLLAAIALSFTLISAADAQVLQGKIEAETSNEAVDGQAVDDGLDSVDWTKWRQKIYDEVHARSAAIVTMYHYPIDGYLNVEYVINRRGEIRIQNLDDHSVNVAFILRHVIDSMQHSSFLKFPKKSQRLQVSFSHSVVASTEDRKIRADQDIELVARRN